MAFNTTIANVQVMNQSIRDTNPFESTPFNLDQMNYSAALIINTTDQPMTISTKWSNDGITYYTVGTTQSVAAGATLVTGHEDTQLTALKLISGYLKVVATSAIAPTTGAVMVQVQGMNQ